MRARPDPEIVAKFPVIEVVPTFLARACPGRNFITTQPRLIQSGFQRIGHRVCGIFIGQARGRSRGEQGIRLKCQVIQRKMVGPERQGLFQIGQRRLCRLPGQRVHQVQIDALKCLYRMRRCNPRCVIVMDPADPLQ